MRLITAHRILIASGIAMCVVYTLRQALRYSSSHHSGDLVSALLALMGAVALGLYLHSIRRH